jgi:hypothetical protein
VTFVVSSDPRCSVSGISNASGGSSPERIGPRLVLGAALVVTGGALIAAFR